MVGCALVAVLLTLCVQLLSITALARRDSERRAIALQQAANLIERVSVMPFDEITPDSLNDIKLPAEVDSILPGGAVTWFIEEEPGDVPAKRVRVEIAWAGGGGRAEAPARLTYWVYEPPQGATP
jgi:hypothetical protein